MCSHCLDVFSLLTGLDSRLFQTQCLMSPILLELRKCMFYHVFSSFFCRLDVYKICSEMACISPLVQQEQKIWLHM